MEYKCHFCGRKDSLHLIKEEGAWVCAKCWELIAEIIKRYLSAKKIVDELQENIPIPTLISAGAVEAEYLHRATVMYKSGLTRSQIMNAFTTEGWNGSYNELLNLVQTAINRFNERRIRGDA